MDKHRGRESHTFEIHSTKLSMQIHVIGFPPQHETPLHACASHVLCVSYMAVAVLAVLHVHVGTVSGNEVRAGCWLVSVRLEERGSDRCQV